MTCWGHCQYQCIPSIWMHDMWRQRWRNPDWCPFRIQTPKSFFIDFHERKKIMPCIWLEIWSYDNLEHKFDKVNYLKLELQKNQRFWLKDEKLTRSQRQPKKSYIILETKNALICCFCRSKCVMEVLLMDVHD